MNRWNKALLMALRIAIGWHFLYEGVWKIDSDRGRAQYLAARYPLQAATARLRNDLAQPMTSAQVAARVDAWNDEVVRVFKGRQPLSEEQKAKLTDLGDKVKIASVDGAELLPFDWAFVHEQVLQLPSDQPDDAFSALPFLRESAGPFRPLFRGLAGDTEGLDRLSEASLKQRLAGREAEILKHFADAGKPFSEAQRQHLRAARQAVETASLETVRAAWFQQRLADYRQCLARQTQVNAPFSRERRDADRQKNDATAAELLSYVNEPLAELAVQTQAIATVDQLAAGPLPQPGDGAEWVNRAVKISLTAIGILLMLGLFTPIVAVAAAVQLLVFYLASPPWPGLPATAVAGHYLYVDRNLIEALAALVVAAAGRRQS